MFTDDLFGGKPPIPGHPYRSPIGNLAVSIHAVDVKVDRHANDGTVHVTPAEKAKLGRIPEGAEANVQADWDESDSDADGFIRNKPAAMKSPAALSFGQKTYDGSAAQTITAADLGALTSHQDVSGKVDSSALFSGGKVKAELLPSYVDDVLEHASSAGFPSAGEAGKIYVAKDTNKTYRWSGTQYVEISPAPDLSNYVQKEAGKGLFSGSYDDLSDKPTIPAATTVDSALSDSSTNPVQNKVVTAAVNARPTKAQIDEGWWSEWTFEFYIGGEWVGIDDPSVQNDITSVSLSYDGNDGWQVTLNLVSGSVRKISPSADAHDENATRLGFAVINEYDEIRATRHRVAAPVPTKTSDLTNDSGFLTQHQQLVPVYSQTWTFSGTSAGDGYHWEPVYGGNYVWVLFKVSDSDPSARTDMGDDVAEEESAVALDFSSTGVTAIRPIIGYTLGDQTTKPLQPKGDYQPALTAAQLANIAAVPDKADASSLPYALVDVTEETVPYVLAECFPIVFTPEGGSTVTITAEGAGDLDIQSPSGYDGFKVSYGGSVVFTTSPAGGLDEYPPGTTFNGEPVSFDDAFLGFTPTYALQDRASNAVSLTADATLVFPAQTAGKARDFVVRLTLTETNDVVPSVTFPADVAYETEGGEWPDLTEAGTYIVRLTEVPKASESETARFFLQCSSAVADATPPSAGGAE